MVSEAGQIRRGENRVRPKAELLGANGAQMGVAGMVGLYYRAWRCRRRRGKLAKAARDDFWRYLHNPGAILKTLRSLLGWAGLFLIAGMGAAVGGWITQGSYPVQVLSRKVLTPVVKPGENVVVEIDVFRTSRCPIDAYRVYSYPGNVRDSAVVPYKAEFGKLGHDKYKIEIPTSATARHGKASIYSYAKSRCNPWEWLVPKDSGDPWIDNYELGPATIFRSPDDVKPDEHFERE